MHKHVMLNIETLGAAPNGCLVEIGAVLFDFNKEYEPIQESLLHLCIEPESSEAFGMKLDVSTVKFWFNQGGWKPAGSALSLPDALVQLRTWTNWSKLEGVWTNAPLFDFAILRRAYELAGSPSGKAPWHYRQERDCRTLLYVANQVWQKLMKNPGPMSFPARESEKHNALSDAAHQALFARHLMRVITLEGLEND